ncbi:response regulator transcription factor, partial [Rhizobiaceae sp. 2RAB30]
MQNRPRTVAVVEDDPSMRRSLERLLSAHGFPTEGYASAESFLGRGPASEAACLVLDIHLGDMSGLELRRLLITSDPGLPVIFITAIDDEALMRVAQKLGCSAFLHKPFPAASLIAAVTSAMG